MSCQHLFGSGGGDASLASSPVSAPVHSACISRLPIGKLIKLQHLNFCNFTLGMPPCLGCPGTAPRSPHRRIQRELRGLNPPPKFFQIRFWIGGSRHRNAHWGAFLYSLKINHFLHKDRDENIKCKAYFAEFGQSECVYFTITETSDQQVF